MTDFNEGAWSLADLLESNAANESPFEIIFDTPSMSAELFELPAGGIDAQQPHEWDELYYIIEGKSSFVADGVKRQISKGDTIFVKKHIEHRFFDVEESLKILVVFAKENTL